MLRNFAAAEHGGYGSMEDCGVSNAEYLNCHLMCVNRLWHVESFVVCIVGNLNGGMV